MSQTISTQELSDAQLDAISGGCRPYHCKEENYCEKKYDSCEEESQSYCEKDDDYGCEPKYDCERPRHHRRRHCWS
jgi:hypothetical protein